MADYIRYKNLRVYRADNLRAAYGAMQRFYAKQKGEPEKRVQARRVMYRNSVAMTLAKAILEPHNIVKMTDQLFDHIAAEKRVDGLESLFLTFMNWCSQAKNEELFIRGLRLWGQYGEPRVHGAGPIFFYNFLNYEMSFFSIDATKRLRPGGANPPLLSWYPHLTPKLQELRKFRYISSFMRPSLPVLPVEPDARPRASNNQSFATWKAAVTCGLAVASLVAKLAAAADTETPTFTAGMAIEFARTGWACEPLYEIIVDSVGDAVTEVVNYPIGEIYGPGLPMTDDPGDYWGVTPGTDGGQTDMGDFNIGGGSDPEEPLPEMQAADADGDDGPVA
jgi:hypothetical protein